MRRIKRVLEIGSGRVPDKIVEVARRHPLTHFTGIDTDPIRLGAALRTQGLHTKPMNLELYGKTDVVSFLGRVKNEHYSQAYGIFVLNNISWTKRLHLFHGLFRCLQPGGRFISLQPFAGAQQLSREMNQAGFKTTVVWLDPASVRKIGTPYAIENSSSFEIFLERISRSSPDRRKRLLAAIKAKVRMEIEEEEDVSQRMGARQAMERTISDIELPGEKPFALIVARKPKK